MKPSQLPTKPEIAPATVTATVARLALALFAMGLLCTQAFAQSTAEPVQPGYVDTNNCPSGFTACWHPYTTLNPQPVSNPSSSTPVLKNGLTNTASSVVSSQAATLTSYYISNTANLVQTCVQLYDVATAGAVTVGTTTPKWSLCVPAGAAANLAGLSISFANGIQVAATTTVVGGTAPGTAIDANFGYR